MKGHHQQIKEAPPTDELAPPTDKGAPPADEGYHQQVKEEIVILIKKGRQCKAERE